MMKSCSSSFTATLALAAVTLAVVGTTITTHHHQSLAVDAFAPPRPSTTHHRQLRAVSSLVWTPASRPFVSTSFSATVTAATTTTTMTTNSRLYSSAADDDNSTTPPPPPRAAPQEKQAVADDEIARLQAMAQKLRAEAAALEADRAQELAAAAQHVFDKFDTNQNGEITLQELKAGLEKGLKTELSDARVQMVMDAFDANQDGKLQLDEMVSIEQFRNKLEALAQEEKRLAKEAQVRAQQEAQVAQLVEARMELFNDREPTATERLLSVLPYLFPLLDSLQWGRFLLVENADNPLVGILALLFGAYRAIPFSGFAAFLALNVLSSNFRINKLIRFNMQQAIFLDIALFFPGLLAAVFGVVGGAAGLNIPPGVSELGSDLVFGALLVSVAYASISSLLGITPDKIPIVSQAVLDRQPTVDMFDDEGRFIPPQPKDKDDKDKEE